MSAWLFACCQQQTDDIDVDDAERREKSASERVQEHKLFGKMIRKWKW